MIGREDSAHYLAARLAAAMPGLVLMLCVLVGRLPLGVPHLGSVVPLLPLAAVFFWSVRQPQLMTPTMVFVAGLVDDVLAGTPLGLGALVLLLVRWLVVSQRLVFLGKPFALMWWGFAIVAMAAVTMAWLLGGLARGAVIPAGSIAVQLALTMIAFPAAVWLFGRIDHFVARAR